MYRSNRSSASKIMDFSPTENCTLTSKNTFCLCHLFPNWKLSKPRTNQKQCRIAGFNPNSQISLSTGIIILKRVDHKMDLTPARCVFWVRKLRNPTGTPLKEGCLMCQTTGRLWVVPANLTSVASTGQILDVVHEFMNCNIR